MPAILARATASTIFTFIRCAPAAAASISHATPVDRLLAAKVLSPAQEADLIVYRASLNPAAIARQIADLQTVLLKLAKEKTEQLYLASIPTAIPDIRKGIRVKAAG